MKELESILDYGTFNPAVDPAFNHGPGMGPCSVAECSLTATGLYWSSTTGATSPVSAWYVDFANGNVYFGVAKSNLLFVRAVRGGCVP